MQISIVGKHKKFERNYINPFMRSRIKYSLETVLKVNKKILDDLYIDIKFEPALTKTNEGAAVSPIDEKPHRSFEIVVDPTLPLYSMNELIFHEVVHIWQYIRGDLSERGEKSPYNIWKNKRYPWVHAGTLEYYTCPWEQEAFSVSNYLYHEFENREMKHAMSRT